MSIEIKMPNTNFNEVEVVDILVNIGDHIDFEQKLIIVKHDESHIYIPSPNTGIVKEIKVSIGYKLKFNELIMIIEDKSYKDNEVLDKDIKTLITTNIENVIMPNIGDDTVEVIDIIVKKGDIVNKNQTLIIVEGDKVSMEIPSPVNGKINNLNITIGDKVKTNSLIMTILTTSDNLLVNQNKTYKVEHNIKKDLYKDNNKQVTTLITSNHNNDNISFSNYENVHATPKIRRLARELNINLSNVNSTGPKGRILKEDINNYIKKIMKFNDNNLNILNSLKTLPSYKYDAFGDIEYLKLNNIQKCTSNNLSKNWIMIPHVTQYKEVDITELEEFRKIQNLNIDKNKKLTLLPFIMKAVAKSLKIFPKFNSSLSHDKETLILKKYINIGIAVDTDKGLLVPVFKNIDQKSIMNLSEELHYLSNKARGGKLSLNDIQGGSFTISNLGNLNSSFFTPIINATEVAILGVSRASIKPIWNGKNFDPKFVLPLSLSFDHRVINGVDGAKFINLVSDLISDIRNLLI